MIFMQEDDDEYQKDNKKKKFDADLRFRSDVSN